MINMGNDAKISYVIHPGKTSVQNELQRYLFQPIIKLGLNIKTLNEKFNPCLPAGRGSGL